MKSSIPVLGIEVLKQDVNATQIFFDPSLQVTNDERSLNGNDATYELVASQ
jgi:hypothetical protein